MRDFEFTPGLLMGATTAKWRTLSQLPPPGSIGSATMADEPVVKPTIQVSGTGTDLPNEAALDGTGQFP
jgi:hypothetical protein